MASSSLVLPAQGISEVTIFLLLPTLIFNQRNRSMHTCLFRKDVRRHFGLQMIISEDMILKLNLILLVHRPHPGHPKSIFLWGYPKHPLESVGVASKCLDSLQTLRTSSSLLARRVSEIEVG